MSETERERLSWHAYQCAYHLFRSKGLPEADSEDLAVEVACREWHWWSRTFGFEVKTDWEFW